MTEKEFHAARWMWAVIDRKVIVADHGDTRSHYEWLRCLIEEAGLPVPYESFFNGLTRGYVLDGKLVAYKGQDFSRWVDKADVLIALDELEKVCGPITRVGLGATYSATDMPWPTVAETDAASFRDHMAGR